MSSRGFLYCLVSLNSEICQLNLFCQFKNHCFLCVCDSWLMKLSSSQQVVCAFFFSKLQGIMSGLQGNEIDHIVNLQVQSPLRAQ